MTNWTVSADSTVVHTHKHAGGPSVPGPRTCLQGVASNDKNRPAGPGREALGRSRGGLTTKIPLVADRILGPSQHGDCPQFIP